MLALLRFVSLRHLWRSPLRSLLTVFGVAVGVATMVGIASINSSVMSAFRSTIDTVAGKADLTVAGSQAGFDDGLLEQVKALPGIEHAAGSLSFIAPVLGSPGEKLYVLGVDLLDDGFFRTYESSDRNIGALADDLEFLNSTDRILVSERFAKEHGLKTGDSFSLQTPNGAQPFVIHGLLRETGPIKAFGGSMGVMYVGSAQEAFGRSRLLDRIDVKVKAGVDFDQVRGSLRDLVGPTMEVERPDRRGQSVEKMVRSFQLGLNLGSGVALLVGVFLVYNTVSIGVVQRRREIGILRALGATKRRIRALFTLEASVFGAMGTAVGIPLGLLVGRAAISWVSGTISSLYISVNAREVHVGATEALLGAALGIGGSVFAALRPAIVASGVPPVEALRRNVASGGDVAELRSWPTALGLLLLVLTVPASWIPAPTENMPVGGYLAMFFTMMGITMLSPLLLRALQSVFQGPGELILGVPGRLAAHNFSRTPVRTAVPVSALSIGVAMTICIAGFVGSFQKSSEQWIDQAVPADLFVTSAAKTSGVMNTPMSVDLAPELAKLPGVEMVDRLRIFPHDVLGLRIFVVSLSADIYEKRGKPEVIDGHLPNAEERAAGWVMVSENFARRRKLHAGDSFPITTPTGERTYRVCGVIVDYTSDQGSVFLDRSIFLEQFKDTRTDTFELYLNDMSKLDEVRRTITERYGKQYDLYVLSNAELRKEAKDLVGNAFSVTYAMEAVAVVLALLGVINTLLAAVLDRTREIGLLRAVGADRRHVLKLFTGEAAFIGLTGGAIGLAMGWVLGWLVTVVVGVEATGWLFKYVYPWDIALQMMAASSICAVLAGLYPARRAARLDVVEALAYE
ncbi:MAG: ABC transporter permease [Myxococcaceae bacterium]|nr:ABC transporter permease [Myxococcaceae bacterium]